LFDARLQLADLRGRVFARLSAEGLESFNADKIWIKIAGNGKAILACPSSEHLGQKAAGFSGGRGSSDG